MKKVFLKISQKSQGNICTRVSFLIIKLQARDSNKETLSHVFPSEFFESFNNTFLLEISGGCFCIFTDTPWTQDVNWTYIRRSEDVQNVFLMSYVRSLYVLCLRGIFLHMKSFKRQPHKMVKHTQTIGQQIADELMSMRSLTFFRSVTSVSCILLFLLLSLSKLLYFCSLWV